MFDKMCTIENLFQFLKGAIKSGHHQHTAKPVPSFNSLKVRLKELKTRTGNAKTYIVSIP